MSAPGEPRRGAFALGLVLAVAALFVLPLTVRDVLTGLHRASFVRDELELEGYDEGTEESVVRGHVVSSGEPYASTRSPGLPPERLRALAAAGALAGHRVPIYYLTERHLRSRLEQAVDFRVLSIEQFELSNPLAVVSANAALAALAALLIRRGVGSRRAR